jgi:hypothetical protein
MADGSEKPIEQIRVGDVVMAFDADAEQGRGALLPRPVTRTFENIAQTIIDLRGLRMTPGHVCLTDHGRFETIAAILTRDGALVDQQGRAIRARTGAVIGSPEDTPVRILYRNPQGQSEVVVARAGIPFAGEPRDDGNYLLVTLLDLIGRADLTLRADGTLLSPEGAVTNGVEWPFEGFPCATDMQFDWLIRTADGAPFIPEWIRGLEAEAQQEQAVGAASHPLHYAPRGRATGFRPSLVGSAVSAMGRVGGGYAGAGRG